MSAEDFNITKLKASKVPVIWVLGCPGTGTSRRTLSDKLASKYGLAHISSGDLLRAEVAAKSPKGKQIEELMKKGELVPNNIVNGLLKKAISKEAVSDKGVVINGYPCTMNQAKDFEAKIKPAAAVFFLIASDDNLIKRVVERGKTSGRADDNAETIKKRLATFHKESDPLRAKFGGKTLRELKQVLKQMDGKAATVDALVAKAIAHVDNIVAEGRSQRNIRESAGDCVVNKASPTNPRPDQAVSKLLDELIARKSELPKDLRERLEEFAGSATKRTGTYKGATASRFDNGFAKLRCNLGGGLNSIHQSLERVGGTLMTQCRALEQRLTDTSQTLRRSLSKKKAGDTAAKGKEPVKPVCPVTQDNGAKSPPAKQKATSPFDIHLDNGDTIYFQDYFDEEEEKRLKTNLHLTDADKKFLGVDTVAKPFN